MIRARRFQPTPALIQYLWGSDRLSTMPGRSAIVMAFRPNAPDKPRSGGWSKTVTEHHGGEGGGIGWCSGLDQGSDFAEVA